MSLNNKKPRIMFIAAFTDQTGVYLIRRTRLREDKKRHLIQIDKHNFNCTEKYGAKFDSFVQILNRYKS